MRGGRAAEVAALLTLVAGVWLGFATAGLPGVIPASAPATAFSAERAMTDLQTIASAPHPVGTPAHDRLRDYLVDRLRALGLSDVHVQSATGFNTLDGPIAATVANVTGRKRGTGSGPAVLLMAHYDAVPRSPGAGDDGAGIAAILETLRALANGPPLQHDLIVLFSDAEEDGLLGAEAFVDLHPWARDAGVVLNFDNRGDAGPVFMFQTSPGNAALIRVLAAATPDARTNSLTGEVYRHLPSDTDLSIWLHSGFGVGALNFAAVGGYQHYHTPIDNAASLDPRLVQHMGAYALGLTRMLGNSDLGMMRTHDAIYFNAPGLGVVHYSALMAVPLSMIGAIAVVIVLVVAARRGALSRRGVGHGLVALLLTLVGPPLVAFAAWRVIRGWHPAYAEILQHDPYNSQWYLLAFIGFTVAAAIAIQRRVAPRAMPLELAAAPMAVWSLLGLLVALLLPGASYLLAWPLLASLAGAAWLLRSGGEHRPLPAGLALTAIPALLLWPPLIRALEVGLTADMLPFCALLAALVLALLVIPLHGLGQLRRWVALGAVLVCIGALVAAEATAGFSAARKRPDSLAYLVDADAATARWVSFDRTPDAWTARALGPRPIRRTFDDMRLALGDSLLASPVRAIVPDSTSVTLLSRQAIPGGQRIHLHVARSGAGEAVALYVNTGVTVSQVTVNGRDLVDGVGDRYAPRYRMGQRGAVLRYFGVPDEGVDLWFTVRSAGPVTLHVVTAIEGLPRGLLPPRPTELMSKPFVPTDVTITAETLKL